MLNRGVRSMFTVGYAPMDTIHDELLLLLNAAEQCHDHATLATQLDTIIQHTKIHFETEEQWMEQSSFPHIAEHRSEHQQLLGELIMMRRRLRPVTLPLVRSFINERLPDWLELHLQRMDSLLATYLNNQTVFD